METYTQHVAMKAEFEAKQQNRGLRMLKQVTTRIVKGEAGMRLMLWKEASRAAVAAERAARADALQAQLEAQMRGQGSAAGLRMLRQLIARRVRGEAGLRIEVWRTKKQDEERERQMEKSRSLLEGTAADVAKGAGLRMLKQILARITKGEIGYRLEIWRQSRLIDVFLVHNAMKASLEQQMKAQGQGAGLRMLRQIMARLTKGEKGYRVEIWKTALRDQHRADDLKRSALSLEAAQMDSMKGAGLRLLKQIWARLAKGVAAERFVIWKQGCRMDQHARLESMRSELQAKLDGPGQYLAIKQLRHVMARIAKGESLTLILTLPPKINPSKHVATRQGMTLDGTLTMTLTQRRDLSSDHDVARQDAGPKTSQGDGGHATSTQAHAQDAPRRDRHHGDAAPSQKFVGPLPRAQVGCGERGDEDQRTPSGL